MIEQKHIIKGETLKSCGRYKQIQIIGDCNVNHVFIIIDEITNDVVDVQYECKKYSDDFWGHLKKEGGEDED